MSCGVFLFEWTMADIFMADFTHAGGAYARRKVAEQKQLKSYDFQLDGSSRLDWAAVKGVLTLKHCTL